MRDDERYPIAVSSDAEQSLPEVVPPEYYTPDKFLAAGQPTPETAYSQSAFSPSAIGATGASPGAGGIGEKEVVSGQTTATRQATICGLRKPIFWVVAVVAALVVVGAVVGGAVGGTMANKSSKSTSSSASSGAASSSASATSTATTSAATPTGTLDASERAIAASSTSGSDSSTLQIFYQNLNTTDILYRLVWADTAETQEQVSLEVTPMQGTPLTATAYNSSSDGSAVVVNLYYLTTDNDNATTMTAQAVLQCSKGATSCSTESNQVISEDFTKTINPKSGLAAVLVGGNETESRVYLQGTGELVWALVNNNPSSNTWSQVQIGSAILNSSLAATNEKTAGNLMVAYVASSSSDPTVIEYADTAGAGDGTAVATKMGSGWATTAKLAACYCDGLDLYHFYYVASDGTIDAYWRSGTSGAWVYNHASAWESVDGGLASVGWSDQVRLIYFHGGQLAMNVQSNNTWDDMQYI